jgi:hypothetical protein
MASEKPNLNSGAESLTDSTNDLPQTLQQDEEIVTKQGNIITKEGVVVIDEKGVDSSARSDVSTNPFEDPEIRDYYVQVYENSKYECRHVFDAEVTWTPEEEKRIVRKLDYRGMYYSNLITGNF